MKIYFEMQIAQFFFATINEAQNLMGGKKKKSK